MGEDLDMRSLPAVEELTEGSYLFGEVGGEVVKVPASEVGTGGDSGGGDSTPPNNYIFTNDETEENPEAVDPAPLNADRLQGYKADDFASKSYITSEINKPIECELLKNVNITTTELIYDIEDISNYKWLYLVLSTTGDESTILGSKIIPVGLFRKATNIISVLFFAHPDYYYQVRFCYVSDTKCKIYVDTSSGINTYFARIYGLN